MERIDVTSLEIRDYVLSEGWKLVKEALKDGLFVMNSPFNDYVQLIFPKDESSSYFPEMAKTALNRLSEVYKLPLSKVTENIREVNDDVISLRYYSENKIVNSISFEEALESIEATRQLLLSGASSVVNPATFHPKLNRLEPQKLIEQARFRHTEEGSFIIKVSCPFELVAAPNSLFQGQAEKPLSRKAFELINSSSIILSEAIEADTIKELYESQTESESPILSYNFCEALANLYDEERELPYELIFNWSKASSLRIPTPQYQNRVAFPFSQKSKIEEAKEYFAPKKKDLSGTFYGTVETLDGSIGEDNKRSGLVILSILYENEILKSRAILPNSHYETAVDAHKKGGLVIQIKGDLKRNKRTNSIENITEFKASE